MQGNRQPQAQQPMRRRPSLLSDLDRGRGIVPWDAEAEGLLVAHHRSHMARLHPQLVLSQQLTTVPPTVVRGATVTSNITPAMAAMVRGSSTNAASLQTAALQPVFRQRTVRSSGSAGILGKEPSQAVPQSPQMLAGMVWPHSQFPVVETNLSSLQRSQPSAGSGETVSVHHHQQRAQPGRSALLPTPSTPPPLSSSAFVLPSASGLTPAQEKLATMPALPSYSAYPAGDPRSATPLQSTGRLSPPTIEDVSPVAVCGEESDNDSIEVVMEDAHQSPTPASTPPTQSKDELLSAMDKVDREITKCEQKLNMLHQQKDAMCVKEEHEQVDQPRGAPTHGSVVERIYAENRHKVSASHDKKLFLLKHELEHPVKPEDLPVFQENLRRRQSMKRKLVLFLQCYGVQQQHKKEALCDEYGALLSAWLKKVEHIEGTSKRKAKEAKAREVFEKYFPELRRQREQNERISRVGSRAFGAVARSEAEFIEIVDQLAEQENEHNERARRSAAVVPEMEMTYQPIKFVNSNGRLRDPVAFAKQRQMNSAWTEEERSVFREKFLAFPKGFGVIASYLPRKSASDCVQYYYRTKKTENYKRLVMKYRRKTRQQQQQHRQQLQQLQRQQQQHQRRRQEQLQEQHLQEQQLEDQCLEEQREELPLSDEHIDTGQQIPVLHQHTQESSVSEMTPADTIHSTGEEKEPRQTQPVKSNLQAALEAEQWTELEASGLREGILGHGKDWERVSKVVGSRTPTECKEFYAKYGRRCQLQYALRTHRNRLKKEKQQEVAVATIPAAEPSVPEEEEEEEIDDTEESADADGNTVHSRRAENTHLKIKIPPLPGQEGVEETPTPGSGDHFKKFMAMAVEVASDMDAVAASSRTDGTSAYPAHAPYLVGVNQAYGEQADALSTSSAVDVASAGIDLIAAAALSVEASNSGEPSLPGRSKVAPAPAQQSASEQSSENGSWPNSSALSALVDAAVALGSIPTGSRASPTATPASVPKTSFSHDVEPTPESLLAAARLPSIIPPISPVGSPVSGVQFSTPPVESPIGEVQFSTPPVGSPIGGVQFSTAAGRSSACSPLITSSESERLQQFVDSHSSCVLSTANELEKTALQNVCQRSEATKPLFTDEEAQPVLEKESSDLSALSTNILIEPLSPPSETELCEEASNFVHTNQSCLVPSMVASQLTKQAQASLISTHLSMTDLGKANQSPTSHPSAAVQTSLLARQPPTGDLISPVILPADNLTPRDAQTSLVTSQSTDAHVSGITSQSQTDNTSPMTSQSTADKNTSSMTNQLPVHDQTWRTTSHKPTSNEPPGTDQLPVEVQGSPASLVGSSQRDVRGKKCVKDAAGGEDTMMVDEPAVAVATSLFDNTSSTAEPVIEDLDTTPSDYVSTSAPDLCGVEHMETSYGTGKESTLPCQGLEDDSAHCGGLLEDDSTPQSDRMLEVNQTSAGGMTEDDLTPAGKVLEDEPTPAGEVFKDDSVLPGGMLGDDSTPPGGLSENDSSHTGGVLERNSTPPSGMLEDDSPTWQDTPLSYSPSDEEQFSCSPHHKTATCPFTNKLTNSILIEDHSSQDDDAYRLHQQGSSSEVEEVSQPPLDRDQKSIEHTSDDDSHCVSEPMPDDDVSPQPLSNDGAEFMSEPPSNHSIVSVSDSPSNDDAPVSEPPSKGNVEQELESASDTSVNSLAGSSVSHDTDNSGKNAHVQPSHRTSPSSSSQDWSSVVDISPAEQAPRSFDIPCGVAPPELSPISPPSDASKPLTSACLQPSTAQTVTPIMAGSLMMSSLMTHAFRQTGLSTGGDGVGSIRSSPVVFPVVRSPQLSLNGGIAQPVSLQHSPISPASTPVLSDVSDAEEVPGIDRDLPELACSPISPPESEESEHKSRT